MNSILHKWRQHTASRNLDSFVSRYMQEHRIPGLSLALTTKDASLFVKSYGMSDTKRKIPVTTGTLFQIGSISKSFTALLLMMLLDEERFSQHDDIRTIIPWFNIKNNNMAITAHHLLTHTAGLPADRADITGSPYMAVAIGQQDIALAPGSRYFYSNIGYQILHQVLESLTGNKFGSLVTEKIFVPLNMQDSNCDISLESRDMQAIGYVAPYDDRPHHRSRDLVEAPYFPYAIGDGAIQSNATDMAAFIRMLLNRGESPGGRIVSEKIFDIYTTSHVKSVQTYFGQGYGYGVEVFNRGKADLVGHPGNTIGFSALLVANLSAGVGVISMANADVDHNVITDFVLELVPDFARSSAEIPALRRKNDNVAKKRNASEFDGQYTSDTGDVICFEQAGSKLILARGDVHAELDRVGADQFYTTVSGFDKYPFVFGRNASNNAVVEVFHGPAWYRNDRFDGKCEFPEDDEWNGFVGKYRSYSPWFTYFEVYQRKGALVVFDGAWETQLHKKSANEFYVDESPSPEILRFEDVICGKALLAAWSGQPFFRTPR